MQQHPVPQNVTQYQFRLVGDMTLKQFLELLFGLVLAYLFYSSNLLTFIKLPLAGRSLIFGIGKVPAIFSFEPHAIEERVVSTKTVKAPTINSGSATKVSDVSKEEQKRLSVLDAILAKTAPTTPSTPSPTLITIDKPSLKPRKLKPLSEVKSSTIFQSTPRPTPAPKPLEIDLSGKDIATPKSESVDIKKEDKVVLEEKKAEPIFVANPTIKKSDAPVASSTPDSIHLPAAPSSPNIVVGMVVTKDGKIVENAIVQILDSSGVPARAIKTNALGQFYTSTPLNNGEYTLEVEKDKLSFPVSKLVIKGDIVSPILLKAS